MAHEDRSDAFVAVMSRSPGLGRGSGGRGPREMLNYVAPKSRSERLHRCLHRKRKGGSPDAVGSAGRILVWTHGDVKDPGPFLASACYHKKVWPERQATASMRDATSLRSEDDSLLRRRMRFPRICAFGSWSRTRTTTHSSHAWDPQFDDSSPNDRLGRRRDSFLNSAPTRRGRQ